MMEKIREFLLGKCETCAGFDDDDYSCGSDEEIGVPCNMVLKPELEAELKAAKEAMEKQKAKKVGYLEDGEAYCRECEEVVYDGMGDYCPNCGQKLDWSE